MTDATDTATDSRLAKLGSLFFSLGIGGPLVGALILIVGLFIPSMEAALVALIVGGAMIAAGMVLTILLTNSQDSLPEH